MTDFQFFIMLPLGTLTLIGFAFSALHMAVAAWDRASLRRMNREG